MTYREAKQESIDTRGARIFFLAEQPGVYFVCPHEGEFHAFEIGKDAIRELNIGGFIRSKGQSEEVRRRKALDYVRSLEASAVFQSDGWTTQDAGAINPGEMMLVLRKAHFGSIAI